MDILPRRENDRIVNLVFSESFTIDPTEIIGARSRFVEYGEIFPINERESMVGRGNDRASASQPDRWGGGAKRDQSPEYRKDWVSKKRIPRHYLINQGRTQLSIIQGDITTIEVDAIVNAANEHMTGGGGIDGVIHRAAGPRLLDECYLHRQVTRGVRLPTGRSRILFSYNLSKKISYIINTAGPVYNYRAKDTCAKELSSCYRTAMTLANLYDLRSIAFPAISCGIFGYPADDAAEVALRTADNDAGQLSKVIFMLFDDHIYDAWVEKAEELKLKPVTDTKAAAMSTEKDKSQAKEKSDKRDDHGLPVGNEFSSTKVIELHSPDSPAADPDSKVQEMIASLPSVPSVESNTPKPMDTDGDETNADDKTGNAAAALDKQKTFSVEMRDANSDSFNTMPTTESEPTTDRGQDETAKVAPVLAPRMSSASTVQPTE